MNLNSSGFCCHSSCLDHFHLDYTALMHQSPAQTNHYKLSLGGTSVSQVHTRPAFDVRGLQCCSDIMSSAFYSEYHSFGATMSPYQHQDCASLPCSPQLPTAPSMPSIEVPSQGYSLDLRAQTRERYTEKGQRKIKARDQGSAHCKAKHTRPTFSGYQIFILEKTFEQNKYLSSVERDKMAYTLGMSQDQVKVWFQNRRTKWKKRNGVSKSVSTKGGRWEQSGAACSNLAEIGDYDRPLDPNSDDERIHLLLQKHSNDCLRYGHQPY